MLRIYCKHITGVTYFQDFITCLHLENEKAREIPHSLVAPLAVSGEFFMQLFFLH